MTISRVPRLKHTSSRMDRIDRLGWTSGVSFVSHGARIGIRVNEPEIIARLPEHLPPGHQPSFSPVVDYLYSLWIGSSGSSPNGGAVHQLYEGAEKVQESLDIDDVLKSLGSCVHFSTALGARRKLFVHAGVVGWRGQAIVIPGRSCTGKTSLVAALVRAGATYCSDEYAVFDALGRVHPYPKSLSIRGENGEPARNCAVETLGGHPETRPLPVALVAAMVYKPGSCWRAHCLSPGQAVLALLDNTVLARSRPKLALSTLGKAAEQAMALGGERGEAEEMAPLLLNYLSQNPGAPIREVGAIRSVVRK